MKLLLVLAPLALLTAAARADDPPPASYAVGLDIAVGAGVRSYKVLVVDGRCGTVQYVSDLSQDHVEVCVRGAGDGAVLELDWTTRDGERDLHQRATTVLPRGGHTELGDGQLATLAVTLY